MTRSVCFRVPREGAIRRNVNIIAQPKQKSKNFFEIVHDFLKEVQIAFAECQKKAKNPFISLKKALTASGKAVILKTSQESWNGDFLSSS